MGAPSAEDGTGAAQPAPAGADVIASAEDTTGR
jgi:hypothetical protein